MQLMERLLIIMAEQAHEHGYSLMEYKMYLADLRKVVQVKREYERLPDSERVDGMLAELWDKADMCRIAHYTEANVNDFFRILDEQKVIWDKSGGSNGNELVTVWYSEEEDWTFKFVESSK